jgi:hypothetical protein
VISILPIPTPAIESPSPGDARTRRAPGPRALDALLADGALAEGQVTEWLGSASCGKTAVLAAFARAALGQGQAVAWIDARRRLLAGEWADAGPGLLWVVRPPNPAEGAFCAEVLLRTGSFRLVVLDEAPPLRRTELLRLQRLAHQTGASLTVLGEHPADHRVHRRFRVEGEVLAPETAWAERTEPVWRVEAGRDQGEARVLYLTARRVSRLAVHAVRPDRPQSRTRPGTRYGI